MTRLRIALTWLVTPINDPIHTACVRIGLTMVVGLWVMVALVEWGR